MTLLDQLIKDAKTVRQTFGFRLRMSLYDEVWIWDSITGQFIIPDALEAGTRQSQDWIL